MKLIEIERATLDAKERKKKFIESFVMDFSMTIITISQITGGLAWMSCSPPWSC